MSRITPWKLAVLGLAFIAGTGTFASAEDASTKHYKIGIIGSGKVGSTLGTLWAKAGDQIMFSSRHPEALKDLAAGIGPAAKTGTVAEAVAFADIVFIALPYPALPDVAKANADGLKGKIVLDASNPIAKRDGQIAVDAIAKGTSIYAAGLLPDTHYAHAFNAISYKDMTAKSNASPAIGIPLASDDPQAVAAAADLVRQAGFVPVVVPLARGGEFGPGLKFGVGAYTVAEWKAKFGL